MGRARVLRKLLEGDQLIVVPGVYDALTARIAHYCGASVLYMTGYGTSAIYGYPDFGLLTMSEMVENVRRITDTFEIPLIADADTGYGNPINVYRTVKEYEKAGAAGIQLEDQTWPKRCGHMVGKTVIDAEEMVSKIKAAVDARTDQDTLLVIRTDAISTHGFEEAIRRGRLYEEMGADVIFIEAPDRKQMEKIPKNFSKPCLLNVPFPDQNNIGVKEIKDMGYKIALFSIATVIGTISGCLRMCKSIFERGKLEDAGIPFSLQELHQFLGLKKYMALEKKYFYLLAIWFFLCQITMPSRVIAAPVQDIKIAVVYPLSGALSRNGNLTLQGVKAAMGWVNDNGGIKSLGGAKLVPVVADSGSTVEGAANAMDRLYRDPDIVMACGTWASSLTLAATEVSERVGKPHFSISSADALHERGFKWGFYVSPPMSVYGDLGLSNVITLARDAGDIPKTAMIVGDNQASSKMFYESAKKYFSKVGIKVLGEETWPTGTLTDATPIMQKIKILNPDMVAFSSLAISETQMCMMKRKELGIKVPFMYSGGYGADPSFKQIGAEFLEGNICFAAFFPHKFMPKEWIQRSLEQCKKEYSDEPWMGQELGFAWTMIPIMAEVLERAGSRNPQTIWEAARKLEINNIPATRALPKQGIAFDEKGRIVKKYQNIVVIQWQGGMPYTVYPPELALAKPIWPKKK